MKSFLTYLKEELNVTDSLSNKDVELVQMIVDALRVKLDQTERHYLVGNVFKEKSMEKRLATIKAIIKGREKTINEATEEENPDEDVPDLPLDDAANSAIENDKPIELEEAVECATKALVADPELLRHSITKIPHEVNTENFRETFEFVKSRLLY